MHFPSIPYIPQHKGHNAIHVTIHYLIIIIINYSFETLHTT